MTNLTPDAEAPETGSDDRPDLRIQAKRDRRLRQGHPWVYSNEIKADPAVKALPAGSVVNVVGNDGHAYGTALYNPKPLICARIVDSAPDMVLDQAWFAARFQAALDLRARLVDRPYYRLIHAEADGLPGVIVDRYGDAASVQINVAGFDRLSAPLVDALRQVTGVTTIVRRNDTSARALEGLDAEDETIGPAIDGPIVVEEGEARFFADLTGGQKTGWFYDQRDNRAFVASLSAGARLLDVYSHSGGFAIHAARAGADSVVAVDRSDHALGLAARAAEANGVADRCDFHKAEAFADLTRRIDRAEKFDIVVCDPPAFAKSRKDLHAAVRGYRKLAKLAAHLVAPGGFLFMASCSHNVPVDQFAGAVASGVHDARRAGRILRQSAAAADHPIHPHLPETAYLKAFTLQLD